MRAVLYIGCVAILSGVASGQPTGSKLTMGTLPSFEAADVHSIRHVSLARAMGPFYGGGRYEVHSATLLDLIQFAYTIDPERVFGGPSWLEFDRFDVTAKVPAGSTAESRKLMLQALLAERFKLAIHNDTRPMLAYKLTGEKAKLKEADGSGQAGCDFKVESRPPPPPPPSGPDSPAGPQRVIAIPVLSYTCRNTTLAAFAAAMPGIPGAGGYFNNKPVVDQTGLKGAFDFAVRFTPQVPIGITVTGENIPFLDALDKQLGLKLESGQIPMPVLVVDSASNQPTPNAPDIAKILPPPPTEFDVAEIKPSPPASAGGRGGQPDLKNGRLIVPGITLQNLIMIAWDLNDTDQLIGAPKWLGSDRFDVVAKAPDGVQIGDLSSESNRSISINIDVLRPMIQSLLVDRFKLVVHTEQRPMTAYTLVVTKPKLRQADPTTRTKWMEGPAPDSKESKDPKNAGPSLGRLVTCQNVTMAQFAEMLPTIAPGYIHNEVVDATGLAGGWDFTVSFSPVGALEMAGGRGGDGAQPGAPGMSTASDPSGALSLLDAVTKQLGLKLEMQKRPVSVIVIDHVEQKPTDN